MDQVKPLTPLISIQCPEHPSQFIGLLDIDCNAKKLSYCNGCITESHAKDIFPKTIKTLPDFLKETFDFYRKCRQRVDNAGEPPFEYVDEFSKKAERLEILSQHIDQEKVIVKERFEEIRRDVLQMIEAKEKECLKLLEEEISSLSEAYTQYEKLLSTRWSKFSDIEGNYPTGDSLEQRISQLTDLDQLQAFVKGVTEDMETEKQSFQDEYGLEKGERKINFLIKTFQKFKFSPPKIPKIQEMFLDSTDLEGLMELLREEIKVENSISFRIQTESQIIDGEQYEILRSWLPNYKYFNLKLLYRGSTDGMSAQMFHEKCDDKGATITIIKCRFDGAGYSSVIGGFVDKSWHSDRAWVESSSSFIFSITPGFDAKKCPIKESCHHLAFYGEVDDGPSFGGGGDLWIDGNLKDGSIRPSSYKNTDALLVNNQSKFVVEEIEVFQVQ